MYRWWPFGFSSAEPQLSALPPSPLLGCFKSLRVVRIGTLIKLLLHLEKHVPIRHLCEPAGLFTDSEKSSY